MQKPFNCIKPMNVMQQKHSARSAGFTLIELLIVISIVALLASISVVAMNGVMRRVKVTQASATVQTLLSAVKSYQLEYNRFPTVLSTPDTGTIEDSIVYTEPDNEMIATLLGKNLTYNPRAIRFLDPPLAKNEANGLVVYDDTYGLVDPWSDPSSKQWQGYYIIMDYAGRGYLDNPVKRADSDVAFSSSYLNNQPDKINTDVLVYSDGDWGASTAARKPVTSW